MRYERALVGFVCLTAALAWGCGGKLAYNLPPSSRLMEPGPGVGGPGPGVIPPAGYPHGIYGGAVGRYPNGMGGPMGAGECPPYGPYGSTSPTPGYGSGVMQASYNEMGGAACACGAHHGDVAACGPYGCDDGAYIQQAGFGHGHGGHGLFGGYRAWGRPGTMEAYADAAAIAAVPTSQVAFLGEEGIQITWDVSGYGMFDSTPLVVPGRQDFYQGAIYRLRLTNIPGRAGVELFPTLEIAPVTPRTDAFLAHSPIPVQFTQEDFDQVLSGNFVTKVIYLPDPEFQELALAGVETLVSTRLDPGVDPIAEADRRGSILAILRIGNKDFRRGATAVPDGGVIVPEYEPQYIVPMGHQSSADTGQAMYEDQALYNQELDADGQPLGEGVEPAQYCGPMYGDGAYCHGAMAGMPLGMPTAAQAPPVVPPNMVAGAPQWGMPITGTPIGLPGPPHVPLGVPAGLQRHVMHNRTRVHLPAPTSKVQISVKQRPGLNYPRPVSHVHVDETQREPFAWFGLGRLFQRGDTAGGVSAHHPGGIHSGGGYGPMGHGGSDSEIEY